MTVEYFFNQCTEWEVNDLLEYTPYCDRNLWETTRLTAYIDAKSHFKNIKSFKDICKFEWENENKDLTEVKDTSISTEDINKLKALSKQWEK